MSHFSVLVILPKEASTVVDETVAYPWVEQLLAPYDENTQVEPYQTACYCVSVQARNDAVASADARYGTINDHRRSFVPPIPQPKPSDPPTDADWDAIAAWHNNAENDAAWQAHIKNRMEAERTAFERHQLKDKPDPTCETCKGTGERTTRYNQKSKWDWFEIGGRWNGAATEDGRNIFPLTALRQGWSAFAIVTPDGQWHEKAEMGWWGMTTNETKDWDKLQYEIASAFPEHIGVWVDCHI